VIFHKTGAWKVVAVTAILASAFIKVWWNLELESIDDTLSYTRAALSVL
jgi:hypothetical protein